jgi:hypothetical protein
MAAIPLVDASIATLKTSLRSEFPDVKSSHLTEALAFALGYRTNAALGADMTGPDQDRPFRILNSERMRHRLQEFRYPRDEAFDFDLMNLDAIAGVIETTCSSAYEIEYKTDRQRAWRNLMVAATNAGLDQKLFTLRPGDNRFGEGQLFDFSLPGGTHARGWVSDAGFSELNLHVAVQPHGDFVRAGNAGFSAGDAFARTWLEREKGAWLQSSMTSFRCRKSLLKALAALDVEPYGYGDRGRVIM